MKYFNRCGMKKVKSAPVIIFEGILSFYNEVKK